MRILQMGNTGFLVLITALLFSSCNPMVTFDEPQPAGVKNEKNFYKKMVGLYSGLNDNSFLMIQHDKIIKESTVEICISKKELDTTREYKLIGDTLLEILSQKRYKVGMKNDTVSYRMTYSDTLFQISDENVLRKFKGYYFLNSQSGSGWMVQKMGFRRGGRLSISSISMPDEIENLKAVTDVTVIKDDEGNISGYRAKPSRRELKKFLKHEGFSKLEEYQKISNKK
jgi:hypothetical protein